MNTQLLSGHIDSHRTLGVDWPNDAEFCVVVKFHTWPVGWQKEPSIIFFKNADLLDEWKARMVRWSALEDNYVAYLVYAWDLGPVERPELSDESWTTIPRTWNGGFLHSEIFSA